MATFKKWDFTVEFSVCMGEDNEFSEITEMMRKAQWDFLIEFAAKHNMSISHPEVRAKSTSRDDLE